MLRVMKRHRDAAYSVPLDGESVDVVRAARATWEETLRLGEQFGYRNAQATVIAPTGTTGLVLDCDTTGIEPDLALVKYKKLVGGGLFKIVNNTVPQALRKLGYSEQQARDIVEYIDEHDTIEGAPQLQDQHLKVFDCAFKPVNGVRSIAPMGHVRMMAAVQPFVSGSQSKTVNMPTEATVDDIASTYMESWKVGLKCIAIYRDGCKRSQPLSTSRDDKQTRLGAAPEPAAEPQPVRRRLPDERRSLTHKFDVQGHEGYVTVGLYDDGTPGEIFLKMAKEGSTISGMMDAFGIQTSMALQYGVPLRVMVNKFSHMRFEPSGFTKNPEIPIAKSIIDYIFRWLASRFLDPEDQEAVGILRRDVNPPIEPAEATSTPGPAAIAPVAPGQAAPVAPKPARNGQASPTQKLTFVVNADSPACSECGAITIRNGSCYKCMNCGATTGCS
jgi:ribonucleoside-diphosphate reductase alpha chain